MNASDTVSSQLADALRERLAVIADHAARDEDSNAHLERLKTASERILVLQRKLPAPVDPRLDHFLNRCSYDKALAVLEGGPAEGH